MRLKALFFAAFFSSPSHGYTVQQIYDYCSEGDIFCYGYISGATDAYASISDPFCSPDGVTIGQTSKIFMKKAENSPERLHEEAAWFIIDTLMQAYPCAEGGN